MKILIVQDYLRSGGTERQSVLLANAFAHGNETTLMTFRPGGTLRPTVSSEVRQVALQTRDTRLDWYAPRLRRRVSLLKPDLVLSMGRMANCYAGTLQRHTPGVPVIATMRTGKPLPLLFRRSLQKVRHVVANSREARDTLVQSYRVDPTKITVIHNSLVFPAANSASRNTSLRTERGATSKTTVLLCVAMFRPEKNQSELIEIAATLSPALDWQLWLAGDGPTRTACLQLANQRGVTDRVFFPGLVRDPSTLYAAADLAVHASSSESLSNFLIEAQAYGLPAVAYAAQGISETFVPDETGWEIPRNDRRRFRERIEQLASDADARVQARADAARAFARLTFDPATQVSRYLELFSRLRS